MKTRLLSCLALSALLGVTGCKTTPEKEQTTTSATKKPPGHSIPDQAQDVAFQGFLSRLRKAVAARDVNGLAEMMTTDFGYRFDPPGEGPGVFAYWDQNNVWPELSLVLNESFAPKGGYMVAPKEFAAGAATFSGYRAGIQLVNGSWKFAYFVSG